MTNHFLFFTTIILSLSACTKKTASGSDTNSTREFVSNKVVFYGIFSSADQNPLPEINLEPNYTYVYLKDIATGELELVSKDENGEPMKAWFPSMSADSTKIAFVSGNYVYVKNMATGELKIASALEDGTPQIVDTQMVVKISPDGNRVVFDSKNGYQTPSKHHAVLVKDLTTGKLIRLDTNSAGEPGDSYFDFNLIIVGMNTDGSRIIFSSDSSNLVPNDTNNASDIFMKDFETGEVTLISSTADGNVLDKSSTYPSVTEDGNLVAFSTDSSNIQNSPQDGKSHLYIKNLTTNQTTLIESGNGWSDSSAISPDGKKLAFGSNSTDLVSNDSNNIYDLFVKDLSTGEVTLMTISNEGVQSTWDTVFLPTFTSDGKKVFFQTSAAFVSNDAEGNRDQDYLYNDVYLKNLSTNEIMLIDTSITGIKMNFAKFNGWW